MLLKIISTKTVFGDKADIQKLVLNDQTQSHFLFRVLGVAEAYMQGKGRHQRIDKESGEVTDTFWTKFAGDFIAVNARNEEFESATCFLPEYVAGPIMQSLRDDEGRGEYQFGFDIFAKYNANSATSYEFIAQPVRKAGETSPAARLKEAMAAMPGDAPALPGAPAVKQIEGKKGK